MTLFLGFRNEIDDFRLIKTVCFLFRRFVSKHELAAWKCGPRSPTEIPEFESLQERSVPRRVETCVERDGNKERVQALPRRDQVENQVQQVQAAHGAEDVRALSSEDRETGVHDVV